MPTFRISYWAQDTPEQWDPVRKPITAASTVEALKLAKLTEPGRYMVTVDEEEGPGTFWRLGADGTFESVDAF